MKCRVYYEGNPAESFQANLIRCWERGEIIPVGGTNGLKPLLRNDVWTVLDRYPGIARVLLMRGDYWQSPCFLLVENAAGEVWDLTAKPVVMHPTRKELQQRGQTTV